MKIVPLSKIDQRITITLKKSSNDVISSLNFNRFGDSGWIVNDF